MGHFFLPVDQPLRSFIRPRATENAVLGQGNGQTLVKTSRALSEGDGQASESNEGKLSVQVIAGSVLQEVFLQGPTAVREGN
jgi:hypothetical protein